GPATAARMEALGIRTGRDLRERSLAFQQEHFGKAGAHFHAIARGEDHRPVVPDRPRKSSGSETTYARDLATPPEVEQGIAALAEEVWAWCEKTGTFGRTVTVKVKFTDFRQVTRSRTSPVPVTSRTELARISRELAHGVFPLPKAVRLLGVTVSGFDGMDAVRPDQISLDFG
ncbi:DinB/UmuC family translesion DNA polymerase, partial [Muricoccus vinaceus]